MPMAILLASTESSSFSPFSDSPGVPPSATAHELFRGFSYVAPPLIASPHKIDVDNGNNSGDGLCAVAGGESTDTVIEVNLRNGGKPGGKVVGVTAVAKAADGAKNNTAAGKNGSNSSNKRLANSINVVVSTLAS